MVILHCGNASAASDSEIKTLQQDSNAYVIIIIRLHRRCDLLLQKRGLSVGRSIDAWALQ